MSRYLDRLRALNSENVPPIGTAITAKSPFDSKDSTEGSRISEIETPESRWPEYAAALASGALVVCLRCAHYSGPPSGALGHCTAFNVEACPVTPFTCGRYARRSTR